MCRRFARSRAELSLSGVWMDDAIEAELGDGGANISEPLVAVGVVGVFGGKRGAGKIDDCVGVCAISSYASSTEGRRGKAL